MAQLELALDVKKTEVVWGESIPFTLTLTNTGGEAEEDLLGLSPQNESLELRLTDAAGQVRTGTQLSLARMQDEPIPHNRRPAMMTMAPGTAQSRDGDVLTWIGELIPGAYTLRAVYSSPGQIKAASGAVKVTVTKASPAALAAAGDGARLTLANRKAAWVQRGATGFELFCLELDARNPEVIRSNLAVTALDGPSPVRISYANTDPGPATFFVWPGPDETLRVLRIGKDGTNSGGADVALPDPDLGPLGAPFCDARGALAAALLHPEGAKGALLRVTSGGAASHTPIALSPPATGPAASLFSRDEHLHLAWVTPEDHALHGLSMPIAASSAPAGRRVFEAAMPVRHVRVDEILDEKALTFRAAATLLCCNDVLDVLRVVRVDAGDGRVLHESSCDAPGAGLLRVIASAMRQAGETAYLLADEQGRVHYLPWPVAPPRPLEVQPLVPITTAMCPILVAASPQAARPGFVLGFVHELGKIERRRLE